MTTFNKAQQDYLEGLLANWLTNHPDYLTDAAKAAYLKQVAGANGVDPFTYDMLLFEYKTNHQENSMPTLDLGAVEVRSNSGLIPGLLLEDPSNRMKDAIIADGTGKTLCSFLSMYQKGSRDLIKFLVSDRGAPVLALLPVDPCLNGAGASYMRSIGENDLQNGSADPGGMRWFSIQEGFEPMPVGTHYGPNNVIQNADDSPYPL